jgi:hypothetical protein
MVARFFFGFVTAALAACAPYAADPDPSPAPAAPAPAGSSDAPSDPGAARPSSPEPGTTEPPATGPKLDVVVTGRPIQAFAIGDTHVFTLETDVQTRLVAIEKAAPHAVKVLIEEDVINGVRFEGVGFARGRVFVIDGYGAMKSAASDGSGIRDEYVPGASRRILSAPQTLWLADLPRVLGDDLVFHWYGAMPAQVTAANAQMIPVGGVGDVAVDDDALVYATRGSTTTLRHWAPATTGARAGHRLLATLPEEGRGVGIDATRAYVALNAAKEIRGYDRTTGASTTILAGATFDTAPQLRSDGQNLYMLTDTALRRCSLASCASTMKVLASGLTAARALVVDPSHAWIVMAPKGKTGAIARVLK